MWYRPLVLNIYWHGPNHKTGVNAYWFHIYQYTDLPDPQPWFCLSSAKYTDYKTGWPPEPIGHKSWKASRGSNQNPLSRPPPGLASQKQPSPSPWSGGAPRLSGRGWGSGSSTTGTHRMHFSYYFHSKLVPVSHSFTVLVELFSWLNYTQERKPLDLIVEIQHKALWNL